MYIPAKDIKSILQDARKDLRVFLHDWLNDGVFLNEWLAAQKEAKKCDPNLPKKVIEADNFGQFFEPFLDWLERRRKKPEAPWKSNDINEPYLQNTTFYRFLSTVLDTLQFLVEPSDPEGRKIDECQDRPSHLLEAFGRMTTERFGYVLSFNDKILPWDEYSGFVSWLLVCVEEKELHIITNNDIINRQVDDTATVARRLEKVYLHELGHAKTRLDYYEKAPVDKRGMVRSQPNHETRAWLYAYAVMAHISSIRSRITRLLHKGDSEWR